MRIRSPWGQTLDLQADAVAIWDCLERGVKYAIREMGAAPNPYAADVAYRREPLRGDRRRDYYQPWWECLAQLHGDCEDLSMWLVAYLRTSNIDPDARVALIEWPSGGWHAVVLRHGDMGPPRDEIYRIPHLSRMYGRGARIYGGPDIGWDPSDPSWYVEDPSRRLGMRDSARGSTYSPIATGDQREPRGPSIAGQDRYVPFEVAGSAGDPDQEIMDAVDDIEWWLA